jgi:hypothetical protein
MTAEQDNAAVVRRFWDLACNSGELPAIEELVDDNFTNFGIRQPGGHAALRHIVTAWRTAFPDLHIQIQEGVTNADLHRGALPNPDAVRLADHMGGHGQRRQALPSIRPGAVTLEGAGLEPAPGDRPRSRRPYRWTGEPRCLAPYRESRAFPSAEASTWC